MANVGNYGDSIKKVIDFSRRRKNLHQDFEKKYWALFENMNAAFALHEMIYDYQGNPIDYRFLEVNPAFEKLTGLNASAVLGKTVKEVLPNTEHYWIDIYGKVAKTGEPVSFQNYAKELGKYYDVLAFCPMKDQFGVIFTDITERMKAEDGLRETLKESEERFRHIFEKASDLIILTDANDYIVNISPSVKRILEFEPEELIGKKMWDIEIFQSKKLDYLKEIHRNIDIGVPITLNNYEIKSKTGRKVILDIMATPITKWGQLIAINSIARDVTQQREIEHEREALLEKTIQISDLKSAIITQAAHELKTPLTAIFGWGEILYSAKKQGKSLDTTFDLEDFEIIIRNAERLNDLINDFIDVGLIDSGKFEINRQNIYFIEIMENAIRAVSYLASQKHISFIADLAPSARLYVDRRRMERVIINLLSNAIKYSPEHTHVTIRTRPIGIGERKMFQVLVVDEGFGFTPKELADAMTPFAKAYTQQKEKQGTSGTGFGLFISRQIVEQHGGTLVIRSEGTNKGTQVEILLPLD